MLKDSCCTKNGLSTAVLLLLIALIFAPSVARSAELATNVRMQNVVQTAVQKLGGQIMVLGSWVSGNKYGDPLLNGLSDHDMRLVLTNVTSPEAALAEWQNAKNTLETLVRKEFGDRADEVLKTCNLYPPKQLMGGVEDSIDALEQFKKLGQVPSLSHNGVVTEVTGEMAEGLYGRGSSTWTQAYEKASGKLIYSVPVTTKDGKIVNQVFRGAADITHLEEGIGRYTMGGMGNTSKQWISHAEDAIKAGTGDKVAKYLERLERDMAKARNMAGLEVSGKWRDEIRALVKDLKADPKSITRMEGEVRKVLGRANFASSILSKMDNKTPGQKLVLSSLVKAVDDSSQFASTVKEMAEEVPLDKVLDLVVVAIATFEVSRGAGEEDPVKVVLGLADFTASLPNAMIVRLTNEILESAKDGGYDMMAGSQNAFDLLDGIYTAAGRVNAEGTKYSIDQLVLKYREGDEDKLKAFVSGLCTLAASRQAGKVTGEADAKVAEAMLAKCYPVILRAWRTKRMLLIQQVNILRDQYLSKGIQLSYAPVAAKVDETVGKVDITVQISTMNGKLEDEMSRIRDILTTLYGLGNYYVKVEDKWSQSGKAGANENQRVLTFRNGGTYPVTVKRSLTIGGNGIPASSELAKTDQMFAGIDIEIGGFGVTLLPETIAGNNVSLTANVFSLPASIKKLGYRWDFGDKNSVPDQEHTYPLQVFADGLFPELVMKASHLYTKNQVYRVQLSLYDLTKGPYVEWVTQPIAVATRSVDLNLQFNEGKYVMQISLECREPKKTKMPADWRTPNIATSVEFPVGNSGQFNIAANWQEGGDAFDDFKYEIQGSGKINTVTGTIDFTLNWRRSRAYVGKTEKKTYDVTQLDTGVMEVSGQLTLSNWGDLSYKQTSNSGLYDSSITFAEVGEDPIIYQGSGDISKESGIFRLTRPK